MIVIKSITSLVEIFEDFLKKDLELIQHLLQMLSSRLVGRGKVLYNQFLTLNIDG